MSNENKRGRENDANFNHVPKSNLYLIKVPNQFFNRSYRKMFDDLCTRRFMVPLGLYRTANVNLNEYKTVDSNSLPSDTTNEENWKTFNYVITNPRRDTKLIEGDHVYVLTKSEPGDPDHWDDYNGAN